MLTHNLTKGGTRWCRWKKKKKKKKKNIYIYIYIYIHTYTYKENIILYTKEAIILNNCLWSTESATYCPPRLVDGEDGDGNVIDEEIE